MKNKGFIISLIIILSILAVSLVWFMFNVINGNKRLINWHFTKGVSSNLLVDDTFNANFSKIDIKSNSSNIYVHSYDEDDVKVVVYGEKDTVKVNNSGEVLSIVSREKNCIGICFNLNISKIDIYLPRNYSNSIEVDNDYGDVEIDEFMNADIKVLEDAGDVTIGGANKITVDNNYGDVEIGKANDVNIKESAGNVIIGTVYNAEIENSYGDIEIDSLLNYVDIKEDCGNIEIDNLDIKKDSFLKNDFGDIKI